METGSRLKAMAVPAKLGSGNKLRISGPASPRIAAGVQRPKTERRGALGQFAIGIRSHLRGRSG